MEKPPGRGIEEDGSGWIGWSAAAVVVGGGGGEKKDSSGGIKEERRYTKKGGRNSFRVLKDHYRTGERCTVSIGSRNMPAKKKLSGSAFNFRGAFPQRRIKGSFSVLPPMKRLRLDSDGKAVGQQLRAPLFLKKAAPRL